MILIGMIGINLINAQEQYKVNMPINLQFTCTLNNAIKQEQFKCAIIQDIKKWNGMERNLNQIILNVRIVKTQYEKNNETNK